MKLTGEQAAEVVFGDNGDFLEVSGTRKQTGSSRWSIHHSAVFLHKPSGEHYKFTWSTGATEYQDESPYEHKEEYEPTPVIAKEITVTEWVAKP